MNLDVRTSTSRADTAVEGNTRLTAVNTAALAVLAVLAVSDQ